MKPARNSAKRCTADVLGMCSDGVIHVRGGVSCVTSPGDRSDRRRAGECLLMLFASLHHGIGVGPT